MWLRNSDGGENSNETLWTAAELCVPMGSKAESDHDSNRHELGPDIQPSVVGVRFSEII